MNNSSVSYLRKPLALFGAGLSLFAANAAFAQTPAEGEKKDETLKLETYTVTGSLIPIAANTPAIPVTVISAVDIQNSGVNTDLLAVLKKTAPYFYGANNIGSDNGNISSGSSNGGSAVSLRNRATLVLINGRRAAVSPVTASGGADFVDVSLIPVSAVERIEVLSDGASATYGSDAVSGVVNVILKTNYRGAEVSGRYGFSPADGKYAERSYSGVFGAGTDKTNITISTEYKHSDPLIQKDRPWAKGQFRTPSFAGSINVGNDFYYLNPTLNAPPRDTDLTPAQLVAAGVYQGPLTQGQVALFFDLAEKPTMLIDAQRRSVVTAIDHRLTDSTTLFADFIYSNTSTKSVLNAQPVSGNVAAATATNPFNVTVTARNRFVDFPRVYNAENWATRGVFGVKGSFADVWRYEAAANFNNTTTKFRNDGLIDAAAYTAAVADLSFNPFARVQSPGVLSKMIGTSFRDYQSQLIGFDFRISGEVMQLPGGPLSVGFGADTRRESLEFTNDRYDQTGGWLQATPRQPFAANSSVDGYFAEVRVPIFDKGNSVKGAHILEFSAAARKELYNKTTDPFVPKYTIRWLPFNDEFAVRATYSESFSAPSLFNLLGPVSAGFTASININRYDTAGNPLNVTTGSRQYRSSSGSNPNLIPSESRNWTAGVVWSPAGKLKGLEISADWFNIDERNLVSSISSSLIVSSVEQFGTASPYASLVRLGQSAAGETYFGTGTPIATPGQMSNRPSDEVWITNQLVNIAGVWQSGADVKVSYTYDTKTWGVLSARVSGVYLSEYVIQSLPTDTPFDYAGSYSGTSLYARYRFYTQLGWSFKDWDAGLNNTYIPSVEDVAGGAGAPDVAAYSTWDARLGYSFKGSSNRWLKGLSIGAGVNNILDEDPPFITSEGNQNHDINAYDPIGRFYYFDVNYKF
jgi:iron complex outermembrane receptor protein